MPSVAHAPSTTDSFWKASLLVVYPFQTDLVYIYTAGSPSQGSSWAHSYFLAFSCPAQLWFCLDLALCSQLRQYSRGNVSLSSQTHTLPCFMWLQPFVLAPVQYELLCHAAHLWSPRFGYQPCGRPHLQALHNLSHHHVLKMFWGRGDTKGQAIKVVAPKWCDESVEGSRILGQRYLPKPHICIQLSEILCTREHS